VHELLSAPDVSDWFKNALTSALQRDPVDAVKDAELLTEYCRTGLRMSLALMGLMGKASPSSVAEGRWRAAPALTEAAHHAPARNGTGLREVVACSNNAVNHMSAAACRVFIRILSTLDRDNSRP